MGLFFKIQENFDKDSGGPYNPLQVICSLIERYKGEGKLVQNKICFLLIDVCFEDNSKLKLFKMNFIQIFEKKIHLKRSNQLSCLWVSLESISVFEFFLIMKS